MDWVASFSALPTWAQILAIIVFGISAAGFLVVTRLGIQQGKAGASGALSDKTTVAAVIVDNTALNRFTDTLQVTNLALGEIVDVGKTIAAANARMPEALERVHDELARVREEIRVMREVNNARGGR